MKLALAVVVAALSLPAFARADGPAGPGPLPPPMSAPANPYAAAPRPRPAPRAQLRRALLARFDRNHDGRLEPRERRAAARALRRLARRLDAGPRASARVEGGGAGDRGSCTGCRAERGISAAARMRARLIRRYDLNGDGNVGPGEMPPALAKRLRRRDRNRDGWLDPGDDR